MTNLFQVPGASLAFERIGSGQASPLVMLHGGPGNRTILPNADAAEATLRLLGDVDLHPRLGTLLTVPTVNIHGREDPVSAFCAASTAEALGATCLVVDACGHAPFVEATDEFFALMRRVINDVDRRRAVR